VELHRGDIVLLSVDDPNGYNRKVRPVVVISDPRNDPEPVVGVCISSCIESSQPAHHILLPFHPQGRVGTGLKSRCVAKCDWRVSFPSRDVVRVIGFVPENILAEIIAQVRSLG
jgi:mRNA-degrading endonuclease toxin of MazEF toxin-antitoxin module